MTSSAINGKCLRRAHYHILKELGIEIVLYELNYHQTETDSWYAFEIKGCMTEAVDIDELHDLLTLLKVASDSDVPAIKDALNQLRVAIGLSK